MNDWSWDDLDAKLRRRLSAKYPNAPDIVQETIVRLFIHISNGLEVKVSPEALAMGIAANVERETWRQEEHFTTIATEFAAEQPISSAHEPTEEELDKLKKDVLSPTERKLFDKYFHDKGDKQQRRERLAEELGVSMNALYQRVFRFKARLIEEHRRRKGGAQT